MTSGLRVTVGHVMIAFFPSSETYTSPPPVEESTQNPSLNWSKVANSICQIRVLSVMPEYFQLVSSFHLNQGYLPRTWTRARVHLFVTFFPSSETYTSPPLVDELAENPAWIGQTFRILGCSKCHISIYRVLFSFCWSHEYFPSTSQL